MAHCAEKNQQNTSSCNGTVTSFISPSLLTQYVAPTVYTAPNAFEDFTYTVPLNTLYLEVFLMGGGGKGGTAETNGGPAGYSWGGGGASAAWIKMRIPASYAPAGTNLTVRVGMGASTSNGLVNGYDTVLFKGAAVVGGAQGGANGGDAVSSGPNVQSGGGSRGAYNNAGFMIEQGAGVHGGWAFSADATAFSWAGFTGEGAASYLGPGYPRQSIYGQTIRNGNDAISYGAGGEGAVNVQNFPAVYALKTGGSGGPGIARITAHYQ